ncbi:thiamine diphosphokinase [Hathewaya massiliensis]|uniref:thiamine diphosphokinase n=1 Tax=Hathewaya massiliensis TaxID=1964382 RepID=UPI00115C43A9|nr:thiamine diphosphokinase [Hathewaya massiliensis]
MKGIIISGGKAPSLELLSTYLKDKYLIIASDSGANVTLKYKLEPNLIVGDLDSISKEAYHYYRGRNFKFVEFNPEKDFTDTELAIEEAIRLGADEILLFGCTGTRIDHVLANLGLLVDYHEKGINIKLIDDNNEIFATKKSIYLKGNKGETFSLQAFRENVRKLTIKNAKYELFNYDLKAGSPLTVSNEFSDEDVYIDFESGILLIILPRD